MTTDYEHIRQILAADMAAYPATVPLSAPTQPLGELATHVYALVQECRERRASSAADLTALRWQPIETAPKDGTRVRLKRVHVHGKPYIVKEGVGYFGNVTIHHRGGPFVNANLETDYDEPSSETHADVWVDGDGMHMFPTPTHWKPLDPPSAGSGDRQPTHDR